MQNKPKDEWGAAFCIISLLALVLCACLRSCALEKPHRTESGNHKETTMLNESMDDGPTVDFSTPKAAPDNEILAEAGTPDDSSQDDDTTTAPAAKPYPSPEEKNASLLQDLMRTQANLFFNALARLRSSREKHLAVTNFQVTMFWVNEYFAEEADRAELQNSQLKGNPAA